MYTFGTNIWIRIPISDSAEMRSSQRSREKVRKYRGPETRCSVKVRRAIVKTGQRLTKRVPASHRVERHLV